MTSIAKTSVSVKKQPEIGVNVYHWNAEEEARAIQQYLRWTRGVTPELVKSTDMLKKHHSAGVELDGRMVTGFYNIVNAIRNGS